METTRSKNGILIRLTEERWKHIVLLHPNLFDKQKEIILTILEPDFILKGKSRELLAVRRASKTRYLVVVYKETESDGFIITSFETTDSRWLFKKEILWNRLS